MSYGLSFSQEFFTGTEDYPTPSKRPTNCLQAIESLSDEVKRGIAKDVLKAKGKKFIEMVIKSETFAHEVLDKLREYDTCDTLSSPIEVYINGNYSVTVYEEIDVHSFEYDANDDGFVLTAEVDGNDYKKQFPHNYNEGIAHQEFLEYIMAEIEKD